MSQTNPVTAEAIYAAPPPLDHVVLRIPAEHALKLEMALAVLNGDDDINDVYFALDRVLGENVVESSSERQEFRRTLRWQPD